MKSAFLPWVSAFFACAFSVYAGEKLVKNGDTIVFMGDSITEFGVRREAGYVRLVMNGLEANGVNANCIGKGICGNKSKAMLARFDRDVIANKPDVVTINAGDYFCSVEANSRSGLPRLLREALAVNGIQKTVYCDRLMRNGPTDIAEHFDELLKDRTVSALVISSGSYDGFSQKYPEHWLKMADFADISAGLKVDFATYDKLLAAAAKNQVSLEDVFAECLSLGVDDFHAR